ANTALATSVRHGWERELLAQLLCGQDLRVHLRADVEFPGPRQGPDHDGIESRFPDQPFRDRKRGLVVARERNRDELALAVGFALQVVGIDRVERAHEARA